MLCPAVLVKNKGLLVLLSVAGSQNLLQVDLIIVLYLPHAYLDIFENSLRFQKYSDTSGQGLS